MARYLYFAFSDCKDPEREKEFNNWYDNMHIPDMLEVPGMIKASRWVNANPLEGQRRKYLALYEFETDDLQEFDSKVHERGRWTMETGRLSDLPEFEPPEFPRIYMQIMPEKKA